MSEDRLPPRDPEESADYQPPSSPEDDHPAWLGLKVATAMSLTHLICTGTGFAQPTFGIITAAFTATQPPQNSRSLALKRIGATVIGAGLGVGGALFRAEVPDGFAVAAFAVIGAVVGVVATWSEAMLFAVVVAVVVTLTAQEGNETILVEAVRGAITIVVGSLIGPAVVWAVEWGRAWLWKRKHT